MKLFNASFRTLALLIFVLAASASSMAEDHRGKGGKPPKPDFSPLFEQLELNDEKRQALSALMSKHHQERRAAHQQSDNGLREQHQAELGDLLSDEQVVIFKAFMQQHKPPRHKKD